MDGIQTEWIEKIFNCMESFYGDRWMKGQSESEKTINRTIWSTALHGCSYDEIKSALVLCKRHAQDKSEPPPHQLEFWRYAKGTAFPNIRYYQQVEKGNPEHAKKYLSEMKKKLPIQHNVDRIKRTFL
jgi:hypothetical protein